MSLFTGAYANPEQAERDRTVREDAVTRLEAELARIKQARERDREEDQNECQAQGRSRGHQGRVRAARADSRRRSISSRRSRWSAVHMNCP